MQPSTTAAFPEIDATKQDCITDQQAQFFRDNGLLVVRNVLRGEELKRMQDQTAPLVRRAAEEKPENPDYFYKKHELTGEQVPFRVEYVIDKTDAGKALLGHPFILRSVEKLQGKNFIPTWDSMVFKQEGAGAAIPWHRDSGTGNGADRCHIFNVDFYLDGSDITNCLWGILGSNKWTEQDADATVQRLNAAPGSFSTDDRCVPILMNPGDVIFHNILVLHGSPAAQSRLRRVVYYEFRPGEIERAFGPHRPEYIPLKQKVLLACLRERSKAPYARGETPFVYAPESDFIPPPLRDEETLETYRYPHEKFWRA
jgi:ectoine hydroxylase-related dioxygenase (phytanoyl-CoA dioxygenase family)